MREMFGAQGSDSWLAHRRGRITASRIADVMSYTKRASKSGGSGSEAATRRNYRMQLVAERLTGRLADHYISPYMERGTEAEPSARELYELATGTMLYPVGFVLHPEYDCTGASPDALIGDDGCLEVKCPKTETLLEWIDTKVIPENYLLQMQWELACTGRDWCHFFGFDDRLPKGQQHLLLDVPRDNDMIAAIEAEVLTLNAQVEEFIERNGFTKTVWAPYKPSDSYDYEKSFFENAAAFIGDEIPI